MNIQQIWNKIYSNLSKRQGYCILPYTNLVYMFLLLLKNFCIKSIFKLNSFLIIQFYNNFEFNKNFKIKFFNLKNKKSFYTFSKLKTLYNKNIQGIVSTTKGLSSISKAISLKQGGILICIFYKTNF